MSPKRLAIHERKKLESAPRRIAEMVPARTTAWTTTRIAKNGSCQLMALTNRLAFLAKSPNTVCVKEVDVDDDDAEVAEEEEEVSFDHKNFSNNSKMVVFS